MNSVLLKENVTSFINKLDTDTVLILADLSVKYQSLMKEGDPDKFKDAYKTILDKVKQQQEFTGIKIFSALDDNYIFAVNALSGLFQRIYEQQKQEMAPERKNISFNSIVDADIWLHNNPNGIGTQTTRPRPIHTV